MDNLRAGPPAHCPDILEAPACVGNWESFLYIRTTHSSYSNHRPKRVISVLFHTDFTSGFE